MKAGWLPAESRGRGDLLLPSTTKAHGKPSDWRKQMDGHCVECGAPLEDDWPLARCCNCEAGDEPFPPSERTRDMDAELEALRMETYEGGPLPDANFFSHEED